MVEETLQGGRERLAGILPDIMTSYVWWQFRRDLGDLKVWQRCL
jgi:hypothetical protein